MTAIPPIKPKIIAQTDQFLAEIRDLLDETAIQFTSDERLELLALAEIVYKQLAQQADVFAAIEELYETALIDELCEAIAVLQSDVETNIQRINQLIDTAKGR